MTEAERATLTRRTGQTVTHTVAMTGMVVWALQEHVFPGGIPGEVLLFVQWAVPALSGAVATWWARRHPQRPRLPQ
ncbi:hypothetical protein E1265_21290 [Streptomyces sp. 8K308]|uniref:hypothetical protein n=1 Tax=Streptomyces sp. 8K308 TaxID=2530388 RepID=UPI00104CD7D5|nr:hypothetical protein [Streptomyces sp. 8K308]TDC20607.1 hypothetical protein E1265_21290 [Streptomyces sp. 8K308]